MFCITIPKVEIFSFSSFISQQIDTNFRFQKNIQRNGFLFSNLQPIQLQTLTAYLETQSVEITEITLFSVRVSPITPLDDSEAA